MGRERELAYLDRALADAIAGTARAIILHGAAGSGKTALLGELARRAVAAGTKVVRASGHEFEADLGFAALSMLLEPLGGRSSLRFPGASAPAHPSLLATFMAAHDLVASVATERPLLVMVDDTHWLDQETLRCLLFIARRLRDERLVLVLTHRPEDAELSDSADLEQLTIGDLDAAGVRSLLADRDVRPAVARGCFERVGGNPLALLEVARVLSEAQRHGVDPLPEALPVPGHLVDHLAADVARQSGAARGALTVAALETAGDAVLVTTAMARLGIDPAGLAEAERSGMITTVGGRICWRHPLLSAAVRLAASPDTIRAAHRALVDADLGTLDRDHLVWHLEQSTIVPDEEVAARLEACGQRSHDQGALLSAAHAFARAAKLSPDRAEAFRRLLLAGRCWQAAGEWRAAHEALEPIIDLVDDPRLAADLAIILGEAELWELGPAAAIRRFETHAAAVRDLDPRRSATLLTCVAGPAMNALDPDAARRAAERAQAFGLASGDGLLAGVTMATAELVSVFAGVPTDVEQIERIDRIAEMARAAVAAHLPSAASVALLCAGAQVLVDEWRPALRTVEDLAVGEASDNSMYLTRQRRMLRSEILWRVGRWTEALAEATLGVAIDGESRTIVVALGAMARVEAGLGRHEPCVEHATAALEVAVARDLHATATIARAALGNLALGDGRFSDAAAEFERVAWATRNVRQPGWMWWQGDAIDAFCAAGDPTRARAVLDQLATDVAGTTCRWAAGTVARGRARLALGDVEDDLAVALETFRALPAPFEEGRTLLQRGRHRQGAGHAGGATDLAAARTVFEAIGAVSWSALADDKTLSDVPAPVPAIDLLTPAERRVARAVAEGDTNVQAATRLFVSVKTVDFHLQSIYRKLGIQRRTQLAWLLAAGADEGDGPVAPVLPITGGDAGSGSGVAS